jgi:hypothetical protein
LSTMLLDKIINTVFSFGAAIVIFGAWGKLENKEFGSTALTAGLLTETAIFCLYGILEWRRRPTAGGERAVEQTRTGGHPGVESHKNGLAAMEPRPGSPVQKEDLEALTGSIKETANLLARIFRV